MDKRIPTKKLHSLICWAIAMVILIALIWWGNTALEVNQYEICSDRVPKAFSGFRIVQVSDLHNAAEFGKGNSKLIALISQTDPDMIVLTGDLVDSRTTSIPIALEFAEAAADIAPVYYVPGNHEARLAEYEDLKIGLEEAGVTILENKSVSISREGERITVIGVMDPSFETDYLFGDAAQVLSSQLASIPNESGEYRILLAHRPELFESYADAKMDLVFSGHAHGGQIRLPFIGGLIAPNQGLFPKYDAGIYTEGNTNMIVSRGVGNSILPIRFNNRPEVILTELRGEKQ